MILYVTPWSRVLLEKVTVTQLVKKLPGFYVIRKFTTVYDSFQKKIPLISVLSHMNPALIVAHYFSQKNIWK
jgi:hypothetical protein